MLRATLLLPCTYEYEKLIPKDRAIVRNLELFDQPL
jgi:hypothetical protein